MTTTYKYLHKLNREVVITFTTQLEITNIRSFLGKCVTYVAENKTFNMDINKKV